jgi:outer membrane protein TolC
MDIVKHRKNDSSAVTPGQDLGRGFKLTLFGLGLAGIGLVTGCTAKYYAKAADQEVYGIIAHKGSQVPNMEPKFTIDTNALISLADLPLNTNLDETLGTEAEKEIGARILPLDKALEIAVKNGRTYQDRKESLYLEALNLTLTRHKYTPIFTATAEAKYSGTRTPEEVVNGVDRVIEAQQVNGDGTAGMSMLLRSGGKITTDFVADFLRFVVGDPRWVTGSKLGATLSQPLLRGAGYKVTMENLTQAERNLLYSLRDFVQFRRSYAVQVASAYYGVLQRRDQVRNTWLGLKNFRKNAERTRAFYDVGQAKKSDLGRLEQQEITTTTEWITSIYSYQQNLDQFKILLGLPTDLKLILDDRELARLTIRHPNILVEDGIRVALVCRLDFQTTRDQFEDSARKIEVAKNGFLPDLNVVLAGNLDRNTGSGLPVLSLDRASWSGAADLSLPLDRKAERNTYRSAQITYQHSLRSLELKMDTVKEEVINGWRQLEQAKSTYASSEIGVRLSESRVDEQNVLASLGRGTAIDLVDAQRSLVDSKNLRTQALVGHTIARLEFYRDLGVLFIKETGKWEEIANDKTF